jgi:GMP synthase (glutamine-hydrolysing)
MKVLRICILVHGPGTRPDATVEWGFEQGHAVDVRHLYRGDLLPELGEFDWLITTGGPMHAHDDENYEFLPAETALIQRAIEKEKAVLGLCLGGQLIARALGASVRKNSHWEVGWHTVAISDEYLGKGPLTAFQWHQDTFELPKGAVRIATNSATPNQGFRLSDRVVGVQFHPEAISSWVQDAAIDPDYPSGPFVQPPSELVQGLIHLPAMNYWFRRLLHQIEGAL